MTALLNLTPTQQPKTGATAPVNLTALLAAGGLGSNTGVSFTNTGREVLYVQQTSTPTTIVVAIGTQVEGEPVTSLTFSGVASAIQVVGPFNADEDVQPGSLVEVTFGTAADITAVALMQNTGTY